MLFLYPIARGTYGDDVMPVYHNNDKYNRSQREQWL
jgi:hypothetical protein